MGHLPKNAWRPRTKVLKLSLTLGRRPSNDRYVASPMLRKFDTRQPDSASGPPNPLDHRVLSIYSAVYRVEAGAWVRLFVPWLMKWVQAASHGGLPGRQCLDAAWDVQGFLEEWTAEQQDGAVVLLD